MQRYWSWVAEVMAGSRDCSSDRSVRIVPSTLDARCWLFIEQHGLSADPSTSVTSHLPLMGCENSSTQAPAGVRRVDFGRLQAAVAKHRQFALLVSRHN